MIIMIIEGDHISKGIGIMKKEVSKKFLLVFSGSMTGFISLLLLFPDHGGGINYGD